MIKKQSNVETDQDKEDFVIKGTRTLSPKFSHEFFLIRDP